MYLSLQWIIIPLLSCAVAQFKEYKSVRMKLYLSKYSTEKDETCEAQKTESYQVLRAYLAMFER